MYWGIKSMVWGVCVMVGSLDRKGSIGNVISKIVKQEFYLPFEKKIRQTATESYYVNLQLSKIQCINWDEFIP